MTSKDKLIEFLKSANILYREETNLANTREEISFARNIFSFYLDGTYSHKFNG